MDFPTLRDGTFPHIDNVDVYQYRNEYDYSRFDTDQAHITVCHVPWDVGLVHVGDRFIEGLGNVVKFASETERNAYISNLSDKFEFDTKYRRYHLELEIKLPIPVDRCAEYNYVHVHHEPVPNASDPVEYESATEGVKDWFFFIRELKYLAPNTTYAVLMLDVWQTFIYRFGISGVMLERGHYPLSQSDTDMFLSDPMDNSAFLLDPDVDAPAESVSASDDVHVFDDDVLFALFTSFDFAGSYGAKHRSGWNSPSIGIMGKSGYPAQTCIAVETSDTQSLLDYLQTEIPQALECVQACAFVPRELVEVSGTFVLGSLTVYNLAGKKSTIAHELDRADFAYPSQYAELAKLYTAPYAHIVITDGADTITIAPQTVSGNQIEIITDLQLIADALRMRSQTVHIGGSNISLGFERLTSKTFTASGSIQDLSILKDIPTYSIYVDNAVIYDVDNHWLNEQRKAEAAARLADATDKATTAKDNAYASAQTANANAYEQAQAQNMIDLANAAATKADATANAYAALNDAKDNADTAKTNADAAALADKQNADASAWSEQTNSKASALADKQNADSNAWAEQTNSNASALADYTNRNSSAFAVKTDADEEGNTKNANAALNVAANALINSYATTDATSQANYNISYNAVALAADNGYTSDTANAQADAQIQSAAVSVAGNAIGAAATGAMAGSVIPGVGTVAGAVAGVISAIPNAAEVAANTAIGVNLSLTQAQLAIANASSKEASANTTMSSKTATSNYYSKASTDAGNNLIADTTANEAALIQANAQRDYACDIDNSQRTYDTEVNNATNTYSAETSNAQNTYDTLVNNATNTYSAETSNAQNTYNIRTQSNTRDNDTAHAIADRDYSIAIGIANRDNTTAIDNADLAKLTAESIADRSQATAKANADRDYATALGIAQRDNTVELAAIDADVAQAALKAPYAVCAGSVQDADAETPNFLDIQIRTMQPSDVRRIGDEFLRFGYAYHGYVAYPDFAIMPRFTFWQCSEIFISDLSIPDAYADQIRYLLIGGVTVWSDPAFIGNTSIYDNVIGG